MGEIIELLRQDRFRTFLSVLGVGIGIFTVVMVLTVTSSLKSRISQSLTSLGGEVMYVQRFPLALSRNDNWWEYLSRPQIDFSDYIFVRDNLPGAVCSFTAVSPHTFTAGRRNCRDASLTGVSAGWSQHCPLLLSAGRMLTEDEMGSGAEVCVIGSRMLGSLFGGTGSEEATAALGSVVKVSGKRLTVVGVFEKQGANAAVMNDYDLSAVVPLQVARGVTPLEASNVTLAVSAPDNVSPVVFEERLRQALRLSRRVQIGQGDNFSINKMSMITSQVDGIMDMLKIVGWVIGGFSLLVGAFGTANIMFVSVRERMPQIGVKKALGAPRRMILGEYLLETVLLSLLGASGGMAAVVLCTMMTSRAALTLTLSASDALCGVAAAVVVGLVAGMAPAMSAARMNPCEAIGKV